MTLLEYLAKHRIADKGVHSLSSHKGNQILYRNLCKNLGILATSSIFETGTKTGHIV